MGYETIVFPESTKFLVTGGAGFIGSNIVEAILKLGYHVRVLDNLSTGKMKNIDEFMDNPKFELIIGDIRDEDVCQQACIGIDYVLHQAAWGSVPRSIELPLEYEEINIKGTLNMLIAARDNNVKRFIYASSSSVYGDDSNLPKVEGREGKPLSPYAITKLANELYAKNFFELYGLKTIGLRYFNVFGKKQDPDSYYAAVIPKFIKALLADSAPTINGDGRQSRDFTFVENVVEANLKACDSEEAIFGEVYNISFGDREYLIDLYKKICILLARDMKPIFGSERKGDIKHSVANIEKAKKCLSYNPQYNVIRGLKLSIEWYSENI